VKQRIITTIALWAMVIGVVALFRDIGGLILLAAITALAQLELYRILEDGGQARPDKILGTTLGVGVMVSSYFLPTASAMEVPIIALMIVSITLLRNNKLAQTFLPTLFPLVYLPFFLQFYGLILDSWGSLFLPIWVIAVAKFSDMGALLAGKAIGRTKLAPSISPAKTVEGAAGGILTSAIIGVVLALAFAEFVPFEMPVLKTAFTAALIGVIAIISDLIESQIKRWAGLKDSGSIVPGIGGAFDLIDSLVLCGPAAFLLFKYLY